MKIHIGTKLHLRLYLCQIDKSIIFFVHLTQTRTRFWMDGNVTDPSLPSVFFNSLSISHTILSSLRHSLFHLSTLLKYTSYICHICIIDDTYMTYASFITCVCDIQTNYTHHILLYMVYMVYHIYYIHIHIHHI